MSYFREVSWKQSELLKRIHLFKNVLGEDLSAKYVMAKKNEYQQFREYVTGWELEKYLHKI